MISLLTLKKEENILIKLQKMNLKELLINVLKIKMPLQCSGILYNVSAFFAEVGETQTCRRLVLTLLAQRDGDQHQNGDQIGEHLEQLDILAAQTGNDQIDPEQQTEQIAAPDSIERAPGGKDNQCHSQPAQSFDGALAGPGALDVVHGVVKTTHAGDTGADTGCNVLVFCNIYSLI